MFNYRRLLFAITISAGLVLCLRAPAMAQLEDAEIQCRAVIAKAGAKLTRAVLKSFATCHKTYDSVASSLDCNDPVFVAAGKLEAAEQKFTSAVTRKCEGVIPAAALFEDCPVPCDADVDQIASFDDVAVCLVCMDRAKMKLFAQEAYGQPTRPISSDDSACHRSIMTQSTKLIGSILKTIGACQKEAEEGGATTIESCTQTQYLTLVNEAYETASTKMEEGKCAEATLPGTFDPCGAAATPAALATCVADSARTYAGELVSRYLELPITPTTPTSSSTTTTTSLPPSIGACPGTAVLVTDAGYFGQCTTNADCGAPRLCDPALGRCVTSTVLDLGSVGFAHGIDSNDGERMTLDLSCQGPAAPGCGECAIDGLIADAGSCRCGNSSESCSAPSASSPDCPACSGGVRDGDDCAVDADCSAGTCTRRCENNAPLACTTNDDCPGSTCPASNNRCDNGVSCDSNQDCTGTCSATSLCSCYLGTPTPVSIGGVPVCTLEKLNEDVTGTVNVDSGASEITIPARRFAYIGVSSLAPCPFCGGVCSHDSGIACAFDDDCGGGNTCILDTAGDGNPDGVCVGGANDGNPCDVAAVNSSFPARDEAAGGAGYSIDCLPSAANNISGAGEQSVRTATTGSSSLAATLPCGIDSGLDCPCRLCSGTEKPCSTDGDCASGPAGCSLNADYPCSTNSDCEDAIAGTCITISSTKRCSGSLGQPCTANYDCRELDLGTCQPSTCSTDGFNGESSPNSCDDLACTDLGQGEGECTNGPDDTWCDDVVRADGTGVYACGSNDDCVPPALAFDAGTCTLTERRECFPVSISLSGSADPLYPVSVAAFCNAPSNSNVFNQVVGLPGPARQIDQQELTSFCAGNPLVTYTPGAGGCP